MKTYVKISCLVVFAALFGSAVAGSAAVLLGPITNAANFHVYYLLAAESWTNSEAEAVSLGGHLVTINNQAEQDFVYNTFANFGGVSRNLWIGMRRSASNYTVFVWSSGQPVTYSNWAYGEPNNCGGVETCGMIYGPATGAPGNWNDCTDAGTSGCDGSILAPLGVVELDPLMVTISLATVNICWNSISNHHYQVEYESASTQNQWTPLGAPVLASALSTCVTDALTSPARFYRVTRLD
jgi:hypothetical protein